MPDCPRPLQGHHYNTHLTVICNAYHRCPVCSMCQKFDTHSAMCQRCEGRKPKQFRRCTCSIRAKEIHKKAEQIFKRPLFAPEGLDPSIFKTSGVDMTTSREMEELEQDLKTDLGGHIDHRLGYVPGLAGVDAFDDYDATAQVDSKGNIHGL